jgi:hypothetical protein
MFKLILILTMGGMFAESGVAISQQEYTFESATACENAKKFYLQKNVDEYLDATNSKERDSRKNLKLLANCWPQK